MALDIQIGSGLRKTEEFPETAQRVLDTLYAAQKNPPRTDTEKIDLLRSFMRRAIIPGFDDLKSIRKAYEVAYLTKMKVL